MALLTEAYIRQSALKVETSIRKSATTILRESAVAPLASEYDIFLSHSVHDAEIVLGVRGLMEELGYSVYVDWLDDPQLDRATVRSSTASLLRLRMKRCKALVYIHTRNSVDSKWMPWELGYFDGFRSRVAILPIVASGNDEYRGVEYLGIYPYVDLAELPSSNKRALWVNRSSDEYGRLKYWLNDPGAIMKRT